MSCFRPFITILGSLSIGSASYAAMNCPDGYSYVPANVTLGTQEFCVMQYEAKAWRDFNGNGRIDLGEIKSNGCHGSNVICDEDKNVKKGDWSRAFESHLPVSVSQARPWRRITRDNAIRACQALNGSTNGPQFDLISNSEWQAIARNIELQSQNWSEGQVGVGILKQGNTGHSSKTTYAASPNGPDVGIGPNGSATLVLSNGNPIFHFSGNVYEWVKDNNTSIQGSKGPMSSVTNVNYGPQGSHYACGVDYPYCGFGYGVLDYTSGAIVRGGYWLEGGYAGVFAAFLGVDSTTSAGVNIGFRCVLHSSIGGNTPSPDGDYE